MKSETVAVEKSKNFDKYKRYYVNGFWNMEMLKNVTNKGKLTTKEYEEITGSTLVNEEQEKN